MKGLTQLWCPRYILQGFQTSCQQLLTAIVIFPTRNRNTFRPGQASKLSWIKIIFDQGTGNCLQAHSAGMWPGVKLTEQPSSINDSPVWSLPLSVKT